MASASFLVAVAGFGESAFFENCLQRAIGAVGDLGAPVVRRRAGRANWFVAMSETAQVEKIGYFETEKVLGAVVGFLGCRDTPEVLFEKFWSGDVTQDQMQRSLRGEFCVFSAGLDTGSILLMRDHVGTRPLYFAECGKCWVISTELRAVMACVDGLEVDLKVLAMLLQPPNAFQLPRGRSGLCGIWRVPAGYMVFIGPKGELSFRRYWDPTSLAIQRRIAFDEAVAEVGRLFSIAVRNRVPPRLHCASHISGGLDSSAIAVAAGREVRSRGRPFHCFSWSPHRRGDRASGEVGRIKTLADREGMSVDFVDVQRLTAAVKDLRQLDPVDYPMESMGMEQLVQLSAARIGVDRLLSGYGGDECVSYPAQGVAIDAFLRGRLDVVLRNLVCRDGESLVESVRRLRHRIKWELVLPLLSGRNFRRASSSNCCGPKLIDAYPMVWGPDEMLDLGPTLKDLQIRYLTGGYLSERMESWWCHGQRFGIDYCYPMLDRDLVEFVLTLPSGFFLREGVSRALFRGVARDYLGDIADSADLKVDECMFDQLAEIRKAFPDTSEALIADAVQFPDLIDADAISDVVRNRRTGLEHARFAIALLRRCNGLARHWGAADNAQMHG